MLRLWNNFSYLLMSQMPQFSILLGNAHFSRSNQFLMVKIKSERTFLCFIRLQS